MTQSPLNLAQTMRQAEQQQAAGQLGQAEALLRQILQIQPRHGGALHLLGILAHQTGNSELAMQLITQAIEYQPGTGLFHANLAEMQRLAGHLDEAIASGQHAIELAPGYAPAHSNLGIAWYDKGELDRAEECQQRALAIQPALLAALNNLGSICRDRKDLEAAAQYYRKVLAIAPQYLESMNNLGAVLTALEEPENAIDLLHQVIARKADYADAQHNLAIACLTMEREDEALEHFEIELHLRPDHPEPHLGLAQLYHGQKNLQEATARAQQALELAPDNAAVHCLLGSIHTDAGFPEQANDDYARALELDPELQGAHLGLGHLRTEQGRMDEARSCLHCALELDPDSLPARIALVHNDKVREGNSQLAGLLQEAEKLDGMLETKALSLHFALGKAFDDLGEYDRAIENYLQGCRLKRQRIDYSVEANERYVDDIRTLFSRTTLDHLRSTGCPDQTPIFVLGMPRSGTTLTEQIIASHPQVHGAGELPDLLDVATDPRGNGGTSAYPASLAGITQAELRILGERYAAGLKLRNPDAARITDKMPANFFCVGLIHLILPQAKIIHIQRNPVDTCLSCLTKLFGHKSQPQSYDLAEIGHYYRTYARLMDHWREVLPEGAFCEVRYEALVANTEAEARRLIDYCALPWDPACLNFHQNERIVRTASVTQVRRPIYNSSVERWRHYQAHLGPLLEALGELVAGGDSA